MMSPSLATKSVSSFGPLTIVRNAIDGLRFHHTRRVDRRAWTSLLALHQDGVAVPAARSPMPALRTALRPDGALTLTSADGGVRVIVQPPDWDSWADPDTNAVEIALQSAFFSRSRTGRDLVPPLCRSIEQLLFPNVGSAAHERDNLLVTGSMLTQIVLALDFTVPRLTPAEWIARHLTFEGDREEATARWSYREGVLPNGSTLAFQRTNLGIATPSGFVRVFDAAACHISRADLLSLQTVWTRAGWKPGTGLVRYEARIPVREPITLDAALRSPEQFGAATASILRHVAQDTRTVPFIEHVPDSALGTLVRAHLGRLPRAR